MRYATFILAFAPLIIPTISAPTPSTNKVEITQAGTANLLAELSAAYAHSASGTSLAGTQADNILVNSRIEIDEEYLQKHQAPESMKAASPTQKTRRQTQDEIQFGHVWKWCRIQCETSWNSPLSQDVIVSTHL